MTTRPDDYWDYHDSLYPGGSPGSSEWKRLREVVLERDGYQCRECRETGSPLDVDHITPLSQGGTNELSNLQTLCRSCHEEKHGRAFGQPRESAWESIREMDGLFENEDEPDKGWENLGWAEKLLAGLIVLIFWGMFLAMAPGITILLTAIGGLLWFKSRSAETDAGKDRISPIHEELKAIDGVGPSTARRLEKRFGSVEGIHDASIEELTEVRNVGKATAKRIKERTQ